MCQEKKHELVEQISFDQGEKSPNQVELYTGQAISKTINKLGKLQLSYLKSILVWVAFNGREKQHYPECIIDCQQ